MASRIICGRWNHSEIPIVRNVGRVVERLGFDITGWHMDNQNRCKYCGNEIPIVGDLSKSINEDDSYP